VLLAYQGGDSGHIRRGEARAVDRAWLVGHGRAVTAALVHQAVTGRVQRRDVGARCRDVHPWAVDREDGGVAYRAPALRVGLGLNRGHREQIVGEPRRVDDHIRSFRIGAVLGAVLVALGALAAIRV